MVAVVTDRNAAMADESLKSLPLRESIANVG